MKRKDCFKVQKSSGTCETVSWHHSQGFLSLYWSYNLPKPNHFLVEAPLCSLILSGASPPHPLMNAWSPGVTSIRIIRIQVSLRSLNWHKPNKNVRYFRHNPRKKTWILDFWRKRRKVIFQQFLFLRKWKICWKIKVSAKKIENIKKNW